MNPQPARPPGSLSSAQAVWLPQIKQDGNGDVDQDGNRDTTRIDSDSDSDISLSDAKNSESSAWSLRTG